MGIEVREGGDKGVPVVVSQPDSPQAAAFRGVARGRAAGFDRSNEAGVGYLDASKVSLPSLNTKDLFATPEIADRRGRNHT